MKTRNPYWIGLAAISAVIFFLFAKSFQSNYVVFSNDGPLGPLVAQADIKWSNFTAYWQDLNWLGIEMPSALPNFTSALFLSVNPVTFAKFYPPLALILLGFSAMFLFRRLGFAPAVSVLGGVAAALNMNTFSNACWGLPSRALTFSGLYLALGFLHGRPRFAWLNVILAGWGIAVGIMEGFDLGAIFSLYAAAYLLFKTYVEAAPENIGAAIAKGALKVALLGLFSAMFAAQALSTLIGTQIKTVGGGGPGQFKDPQAQWDFATQWSLPKIETIRVIIPGLFGYRMTDADGRPGYPGAYWGTVGQQPGWEQHHQGLPRHSGSGEYAGLLVVLLAAYALAQAARGAKGIYSTPERRFIWFWAGAAVISLLLAFGRHAPFYRLFYALPYFSTIRNPAKLMHPFQVSIVILFAYGLQGVWRTFLQKPDSKLSITDQLKTWWKNLKGFDAKWAYGTLLFFALSLVGLLVLASSRKELERHLQNGAFSPDQAPGIASFAVGEMGQYVLFLALSIGALFLLLSGALSGKRAGFAAVLLGVILTVDLSRANVHWIVYEDYLEKYATNPILDILRKEPYLHRVTSRIAPQSGNLVVNEAGQPLMVLDNEWLQHQFPYYNIQSVDIVQLPRTPDLDATFMEAFRPKKDTEYPLASRLWELSNTRYVISQREILPLLNSQFDPGKGRFKLHTAFDIALKPGTAQEEGHRVEKWTVVPAPEGRYAIFEFTGALPRAGLFTTWKSGTDDASALRELANPLFHPAKIVLVSDKIAAPPAVSSATNQTNNVLVSSYSPKRIELQAQAAAQGVLLLNNRYHPQWQVFVDGKLETLLRCNYIMSGVLLSPGTHKVEFRLTPSPTTLYISLAAAALGIALVAFTAFAKDPEAPAASPGSPNPKGST